MPGNIIELNGKYRWYVGDSKMDEVITKMDEIISWLNENGVSIVDCPVCGAGMEPNVRARLLADPEATHEACQACGAELEIGGIFV